MLGRVALTLYFMLDKCTNMSQCLYFFTALFGVISKIDTSSSNFSSTLQVTAHCNLQPLDKVNQSISLDLSIANLLF